MSAPLPRVIASSVIRSSYQGESHGGLYLVDLESGTAEQVMDWDKTDICWDGRGGERGLRGVAVSGKRIFVAAYDAIYELGPDFQIRGRYDNRYLRDCHEVSMAGDRLFVASTGSDSILEFDVSRREFVGGYHFRFPPGMRLANKALKRLRLDRPRPAPRARRFDPTGDDGPPLEDRLHLNSVHLVNGSLIVAGTQIGVLVEVGRNGSRPHQRIPFGTHNARPHREGVIANDTERDRLAFFVRGRARRSWHIPRFDDAELAYTHLPSDYARQAYGRGLCVGESGHIVAGASPATISAYQWNRPEPHRVVQISRDVRNAVHGLAIWS